MENNAENQIKNIIIQFYLNSRDFNGIPFDKLYQEFGDEAVNCVISLAEEKIIDIYFDYENPHVMRLPLDFEKTLEAFKDKTRKGEHKMEEVIDYISNVKTVVDNFCCCLYPSINLIKANLKSKFRNKYYSKKLALNRICLDYRVFDNKLLLEFIHDPRYSHYQGDFTGSIWYCDEHQLKSEQKFIPHYYFALDKKTKQRKIAILLCDLHELDGNYQKVLKDYELDYSNYTLHPESDKMIKGDWDIYTSIFEAFLKELEYINAICKLCFGIEFFKNTFSENTPNNFTFLLIPTEKEYQDFVHTLDKMLSDNINKDFFNHVDTESKIEKFETKKDVEGSEYKAEKGTLKLLKDWLLAYFKTLNQDKKDYPADQICGQFRKIRSERSKGTGHSIISNNWDENLYAKQRELIKKTYGAIRLLRTVLQNIPGAKNIDIDQDVYEGNIISY